MVKTPSPQKLIHIGKTTKPKKRLPPNSEFPVCTGKQCQVLPSFLLIPETRKEDYKVLIQGIQGMVQSLQGIKTNYRNNFQLSEMYNNASTHP